MKSGRRFAVCLLCFALLLSATSCDIKEKIVGGIADWVRSHENYQNPEGYTGGFLMESDFYMGQEIHWVETFEEATYIIEQLEAYGNEVPNYLISSYENETVDAKYCFIVNTNKTIRQNKGEEWYQRKFKRIEAIRYYAFLENISIDELERSYIFSYRSMELISKYGKNYFDDVEIENLIYDCEDHNREFHMCNIKQGYSDDTVAVVYQRYYDENENLHEELPENFHDEFLKSLVAIGGN